MFVLYACFSYQIVHKQLTCESVLIFENFILKLTNFGTKDSSTDQPEKPSTTTRVVSFPQY